MTDGGTREEMASILLPDGVSGISVQRVGNSVAQSEVCCPFQGTGHVRSAETALLWIDLVSLMYSI
jgi:hypothetical protein